MPMHTIPRPTSLDQLPPLDAAVAVSSFIGAPQSHGNWCIKTMTVTEADATTSYLRSFGDGGGRHTPAGTYIGLHPTDPTAAGYETMMSNTPDEMTDHLSFIEAAEGRVLVTGLGLSCVVSGLLANPHVEHIDVLELDPSVIAMVGPAYAQEPRVTIHQGDAMTYEWGDSRWDYAWHDIWPTISPRNLTGEDADDPTYAAMFTRYAERATYQDAWAFAHAIQCDTAEELADVLGDKWTERFASAASADERYDILLDYYAQPSPVLDALNGRPETPEEAKTRAKALVAASPQMEADLRQKAAKDSVKFWFDSGPLMPEAASMVPELRAGYLNAIGLVPERVTGLATRPLLYRLRQSEA